MTGAEDGRYQDRQDSIELAWDGEPGLRTDDPSFRSVATTLLATLVLLGSMLLLVLGLMRVGVSQGWAIAFGMFALISVPLAIEEAYNRWSVRQPTPVVRIERRPEPNGELLVDIAHRRGGITAVSLVATRSETVNDGEGGQKRVWRRVVEVPLKPTESGFEPPARDQANPSYSCRVPAANRFTRFDRWYVVVRLRRGRTVRYTRPYRIHFRLPPLT